MVASRMQDIYFAFSWLDRPITGLAARRPAGSRQAGRVRRDLRSGAKRTFELFYSGVRESELHSGAHGAAQRADAEGRQSL